MKKVKAPVAVPSVPSIYQNLEKDASRRHLCLVEDVHGQFFVYENDKTINIVKQAQQRVWKNFDAFAEEPKQTLLTYHANAFKSEPPKDQDLVTTAIMCWFFLCQTAVNIAAHVAKTPRTEDGRKSTISNSKYTRGNITLAKGQEAGTIKTPQAIACYRIFSDAIDAQAEKDTKDMPEDLKKTHVASITEADLKQQIVNRAGEIKTRQDPWRIFQYYRPELIKAELIRRN